MLPIHEYDLERFHKLCKELTGDAWCPYPSLLMIYVCFLVDNKTAKSLIEQRRKYLFIEFLIGEPMEKELMSHVLIARDEDE